MHAWEAIQQSVDHIELCLSCPPSAEQLAREVGLSPFYFQRLFTRLVHRPVGEYIRLRRLALASERLAAGEKVVTVALDTGFESHEGFTRAFKAAYGLTPAEYRALPQRLNHFEKPEIALQYTLVDEGVPLLVGGIVLEVSRRTLAPDEQAVYAGITRHLSIQGQVPPGEATGVDAPGRVWDEFHALKPAIPGLAKGGEEFGASFFGNAPKGCFSYFAGARMAESDLPCGSSAPTGPCGVPVEGLSGWRLAPGEYAVCRVEAESLEKLVHAALDEGLKYLIDTWIPKHGLKMEPYSCEKYCGLQNEAWQLELWVKLPEPA